VTAKESVNYYELLQIPQTADDEMIRRAYRNVAARLHPDNPSSGDVECFLMLQQAFRVLSDPATRAKYDSTQNVGADEPVPIFEMNRFNLNVNGEIKHRLAVLALLYRHRRMEAERPGMSLLDLEKRLAFPREELNFALWYLCSKNYVKREQSGSEYSLTVIGADHVEEHFQAETSSRTR
jgi:curved DNA-binding protein CbpA